VFLTQIPRFEMVMTSQSMMVRQSVRLSVPHDEKCPNTACGFFARARWLESRGRRRRELHERRVTDGKTSDLEVGVPTSRVPSTFPTMRQTLDALQQKRLAWKRVIVAEEKRAQAREAEAAAAKKRAAVEAVRTQLAKRKTAEEGRYVLYEGPKFESYEEMIERMAHEHRARRDGLKLSEEHRRFEQAVKRSVRREFLPYYRAQCEQSGHSWGQTREGIWVCKRCDQTKSDVEASTSKNMASWRQTLDNLPKPEKKKK